MYRGDMTNQEWNSLKAVLPKRNTRVGRPPVNHRRILNGILWVMRTGAAWRDLPARYGRWTTVYSRKQRWNAVGVWPSLKKELEEILDVDESVNLSIDR